MSLRAVHAGAGYQYLLRSVATNDAHDKTTDTGSLANYYQAKGTPPGRWFGSGLAGFNTETIVAGATIEADQMASLYGVGMHPDTDAKIAAGTPLAECKLGGKFPVYTNAIPVLDALRDAEQEFTKTTKRLPSTVERSEMAATIGRPFYVQETGYDNAADKDVIAWVNKQQEQVKQAVSAYDFTFSPVKSISVVWALADEETATKIARCHHRAVAEALAWAEANIVRTRMGKAGIAQVETHGLVASEFTHFDTRAGDPDLHSHVLISNKVQGKDGKWRTLDGRTLFTHHQAISAHYDAVLNQILSEELGIEFEERPRKGNTQGVWEVKGVPQEVVEQFSQRRTNAEPVFDQLVADYIRNHGRQPDKLTKKRFWQEAILTTRDAKKPAESLDTLRREWAQVVSEMDGGTDYLAAVRSIVGDEKPGVQGRIFDAENWRENVETIAGEIIEAVSEKRANFGEHHVRTACSTALKGWRFSSVDELDRAREQIITVALDKAVSLTPDEQLTLPSVLVNARDYGVDRLLGAERFTTEEVIETERKVLNACVEPVAVFARNATLAQALNDHERASGFALNAGQKDLAEHLLNAGTLVASGVGPAGTGKTTSMQIVADVWASEGQKVIGLAPSAAAAQVLEEEIGAEAMTIDKLVFTWLGKHPDRRGGDLGELPVEINPGDMLLVDEAGMASTTNLGALVDIAREAGAVVRLIGDPYQLSAIGSGGLFKTLCQRAGAASLTEIMRFSRGADTAQGEASMKIRAGDTTGLGLYFERGWVKDGTRETMLTRAVDSYLTDIDAGRTSLVIAPSNADVDAANEMIRAVRVEQGLVDTSVEMEVARGDRVSPGDIVITRKNAYLPGGGRVINGQMFTVIGPSADGQLDVRDLKTNARVRIPADYAADNVHLGYASTVHRAQGATVDVCHSLVDMTVRREALYVALTRGKMENRSYVVTDLQFDLDAEDPHFHMAGNDQAPTALAVLERAVDTSADATTAIDEHRKQVTIGHSPARLRELYDHGVDLLMDQFIDTYLPETIDNLPTEAVEKIIDQDAEGVLRAIWKNALKAGKDPREVSIPVAGVLASDDLTRLFSTAYGHSTKRETRTDEHPLQAPPVMFVGQDNELAQWVETTYAQLGEQSATAREPMPVVVDGQEITGAAWSGMQATTRQYSGARFTDCALTATSFADCSFSNVVFRDCDLTGVDFSRASFDRVRFIGCTLDGADFTGATLGSYTSPFPVDIVGCPMRGATMEGTDIVRATFRNIDATGASFVGATLNKTVWRAMDLTDTRWDERLHVPGDTHVVNLTGDPDAVALVAKANTDAAAKIRAAEESTRRGTRIGYGTSNPVRHLDQDTGPEL